MMAQNDPRDEAVRPRTTFLVELTQVKLGQPKLAQKWPFFAKIIFVEGQLPISRIFSLRRRVGCIQILNVKATQNLLTLCLMLPMNIYFETFKKIVKNFKENRHFVTNGSFLVNGFDSSCRACEQNVRACGHAQSRIRHAVACLACPQSPPLGAGGAISLFW